MSNSFLNPVTTQTWANGRHIVRCVKVIQETWDVRTFCFMADQPILFLSLIFCYAYQRTGSIIPSMVGHALNNSAAFCILYFTTAPLGG